MAERGRALTGTRAPGRTAASARDRARNETADVAVRPGHRRTGRHRGPGRDSHRRGRHENRAVGAPPAHADAAFHRRDAPDRSGLGARSSGAHPNHPSFTAAVRPRARPRARLLVRPGRHARRTLRTEGHPGANLPGGAEAAHRRTGPAGPDQRDWIVPNGGKPVNRFFRLPI